MHLHKNIMRHNGFCFLLCAILVLLSLHVGSSALGLVALAELLLACVAGGGCAAADPLAAVIFFELRVPRTLIAALCGGALAAAGVVSQGMFRNALASPAVLGTSTGGGLGAVLVFYGGAALHHWYSLPLAAFTGALLVTGLVIFLAQRHLMASTERLLLAGFAINAFCGALTSLVIFLLMEEHYRISSVLHWLFGGFAGRGWQHLPLLLLPCVLGIVLCYRLCVRLDALCLREEVARSLGINLVRLRAVAIVAIALLVGSTVAVAGALPFVGLMIPHVCRLFYGAGHRNLLGKSIINGMSFVLLVDVVTRWLGGVRELDAGIVTALLGGPFFLLVLLQQNRRAAYVAVSPRKKSLPTILSEPPRQQLPCLQLELKNLQAEVAQQKILHPFSCVLAGQKFISVLGRNGAGKTTLLRCLVGLEGEGQVLLHDTPLKAMAAKQRARMLSWIPEPHAPAFAFAVYEVVLLGRYAWHGGTPQAHDHACTEAMLRWLGLEKFRHRAVNTLSAGERQRVLLARGLNSGSPVIVIDEPTAALDVYQERQVLRFLHKLTRRGHTVIAAWHDVGLAQRYSDSVVLMDAGRAKFFVEAKKAFTYGGISDRIFGSADLGKNKNDDGREFLR